MTLKKIATALVLILLNSSTSAQVYQWKDKSGRTILSDSPPPPGSKPKLIEVDRGGSNQQKSTADIEIEFRKRQQESQKLSEDEAKKNTAKAQQKIYCDDAKRQLSLLKSGERISTREINGERKFMEEDQRNKEITTTERYMNENCKSL